jgi:hypothetical protein
MKVIKELIGNTNQDKHFLGFVSVDDFLTSLLKLKHWSFTSTIAIMGVLTTFITDYVFDSYQAVYILYSLMGADWITGILKSMKAGAFESYKIMRMPLFYIAITFLVSISWWMAKYNILFTYLPSIVMTGLYSVYFISLLENLGELKVLPKAFVGLLIKRFGLKALLEMASKIAIEEKKEENEKK